MLVSATKRVFVSLVAVALFAYPAYADDKSDFDDFKDKYNDFVGKDDDLNDRVKDFIEVSKDLRRQDKEELQKLIKGICGLDTETGNDDAATIANDLVFDAVSTVSQFYDRLNNDVENLIDDLKELMNDQKALRDEYKGLIDSEEIGDEAKRLIHSLGDLIDTTTNRYGKISDDYRSLSNIKDGVMKGTNNPTIRAKLEYGKKKHIDLQRNCDEAEVIVSAGKADCVNFDNEDCTVIEFKPGTYSEDEAKKQAAKYLDGIQSKYKTDSRAVANCKKDSNGEPIFEPRGELYPACRP